MIAVTWLDPIICSPLIQLEGYSILRQDRNGIGGVVALFIHDTIAATLLCLSDGHWSGKPDKQEFLLREVSVLGHSPLFVAVVYRPPHAPFLRKTVFINKICSFMHSYSTKVILGYFNADQLSSSDAANFIYGFIDENELQNIPYGATHHTPTSDTQLDLCMVDQENALRCHSKSDTPFVNGHDLISATINISVLRSSVTPSSFRNYKSINASALNEFLETCDCLGNCFP